jgi:hypothetical protein
VGCGPVYDETGAHSHSGSDAVGCDALNAFFWPMGIEEGTTYNVSVWAKAAPGSTTGRIVIFWNNITEHLGTTFRPFPVTTTYQQFSIEATAPPGANVARIVLQGHETDKFVYFDDVTVRNVTTAMTNELLNPGFENDVVAPIGIPDDWWNNSVPVYDTSGTQSHSGTDACQVNATRQLLQVVPAKPGRTYYLGEWIKGASGGELFQVALVFFDSAFNGLDAVWYFATPGTSYEYVNVSGFSPPDTAYVVPVITTAQDSDFVWVDDVFLNETSPLNPGVSRGPVLDGHPELEAEGVYYNFEDVTSPSTSNLLVPYGELVSAVAAPILGDGSLDLSQVTDVASSITGGYVQWSPASGDWRVMAFVKDILYNGTEVDPAICNMHQINVMNPTAVQGFINEMYQKTIYDNMQPYTGNMVSASFTDEVSNLGAYFLNGEAFPVIAWLDDDVNNHYITTEFTNLHGYDLVSVLPALFNDCGPMTGKHRMDFYNTTGYLQGQGFYKMIGDWCEQRGMNFSGHLLSEESLISHTAFYGDFFESIKYMGIPGMDTLLHAAGEINQDVIVPKMVSSATSLYGKEHSMTEYSVNANHMHFRNMTGVVNWEAVQGIDIVTSFAFWVGYVPDEELINHSLHIGRTNYMLDQGNYTCDIGVLYPISTIQSEYIPRTDVIWNRNLFGGYDHDQSFIDLTSALLSNQQDFIYINDENMDRAVIDNSTFETVLRHDTSGLKFKIIVVPEMDAIKNSTLQKLKAFYDAGGIVISVGDLPQQIRGIILHQKDQFKRRSGNMGKRGFQ